MLPNWSIICAPGERGKWQWWRTCGHLYIKLSSYAQAGRRQSAKTILANVEQTARAVAIGQLVLFVDFDKWLNISPLSSWHVLIRKEDENLGKMMNNRSRENVREIDHDYQSSCSLWMLMDKSNFHSFFLCNVLVRSRESRQSVKKKKAKQQFNQRKWYRGRKQDDDEDRPRWTDKMLKRTNCPIVQVFICVTASEQQRQAHTTNRTIMIKMYAINMNTEFGPTTTFIIPCLRPPERYTLTQSVLSPWWSRCEWPAQSGAIRHRRFIWHCWNQTLELARPIGI